MTRPEFDFEPFEFQEEQEAWEHERRRGPAPPRPARPVPGRPRLPARRPWPGATRFDQPPGPCVCPAHGIEFVRWVQSTLNRVEGAELPVDGVMSAATRSALRRFQRRRRLPADGIAGPETERALREARGPAQPQPEPARDLGEIYEFETLDLESATSMPTLRQGSRGSAVTDLQRRLAAAGFSPGAADGIFGSLTGAAVRSFQRARGLGADGIVGPQTWGALLGTPPNAPGVGVPATPPVPTLPPVPYKPASGLRARIVQVALQEWQRWGKGTIKESAPAMRKVLDDYWLVATGQPYTGAAWSAAFISWVMYQAGAGSQFRYSSGHTVYVAAAKGNRFANNANPFKAYRISEAAPRPGDLVCAERSSSGVTYDNVDDGQFRESHSDVVVEVRSGWIVMIGGNVSDSVSRKEIEVNPATGKLSGAPYYAVIRSGE